MAWSFRIFCGSVRPLCILSREKSGFLSSHENDIWVGQVNIKEESGRVCLKLLWMRVKFLYMKQFTALKRATSSWSFSILSSKSWREVCSSRNGTRSVRPGGKYRSIWHTKISVIQTGNFGRMERARNSWKGSPVFPVETSQWKICVPFTDLLSLSPVPCLSRSIKRPGLP